MASETIECATTGCVEQVPLNPDGEPDGEACNRCGKLILCYECWDINGRCGNKDCSGYDPRDYPIKRIYPVKSIN